MAYNVAFISLGCAKNQVNCEQMMAAAQAAGNTVQAGPEGADVVVVNTCGFLASACEEAIENILEMAELKKAGKVKKILVSGCMAQRYQKDILQELPEVLHHGKVHVLFKDAAFPHRAAVKSAVARVQHYDRTLRSLRGGRDGAVGHPCADRQESEDPRHARGESQSLFVEFHFDYPRTNCLFVHKI